MVENKDISISIRFISCSAYQKIFFELRPGRSKDSEKSDNKHTVKGLYTQSFVTLNLKGKFIWKQVHHECIEKLSYVRFTWKQIHDETLKRFCMLYKIFSVL